MMNKRQMVAGGFALAAVLLGDAGAVAAAHPIRGPAPQGPAATSDQPDTPGLPDLPEAGDTPDAPGN